MRQMNKRKWPSLIIHLCMGTPHTRESEIPYTREVEFQGRKGNEDCVAF